MYRLYFLLYLFLIYSCANIQAPSGGQPDTTPPVILETVPSNNSINYNDRILLVFSQWMDRTSVIENLSIIPDVQFEYNWKGKKLEIKFKENLKENTTYTILLGTEYTDYYKNKPESSFSLVFSSGNNIDTGRIKGKIIGEKIDGAYVFAYYGNAEYFDTLNPILTKPQYRIQVATNGNFTIPALKDGRYRLIAIKDQLKSGLYSLTAPFGVAQSDVEVSNGIAPFVEIKLGEPIDKTPPAIININSFVNNLVSIKFSEKIVDSSLFKSKINVIDTSFSDTIPIIAKFKNTFEENTFQIIPERSLTEEKIWTLVFDENNLPYDTNFNKLDIRKIPKFITYNRSDTIPIRLLTKPFKDSTKNVAIDKTFDFTFTNAIYKDMMKLNYKLIQKSNNSIISLDTLPSPVNQVLIAPKKQLNENTEYLLTVEFNSVSSLTNDFSIDTTINLYFKTDDYANYGSISGNFINKSFNCQDNLILVIFNKNYRFSQKLGRNGEFIFNNIPADTYNIEIYCDRNNNGSYDYGVAYPFEFAEKFYLHNQSITVKARWLIENIQIIETNNVAN